MDRPRMGKTSAASSLVLAGVPILLGVVLLLPFAAGKEDAITTGPQSSFLYWVLDSSMWAIALYYILTRRAAFIELFQRFILRQDELSAQIDEIELKATELADGYEEITKRLPSIHGTRHNAKLIAILTALDAATRRMLDSLPLPSSPTKDEGAGDSSLSVSREDGEPEVVAPHDIEPAVSTADGGDLDATTESVKELPAALPYTTADAQQGESDQAKASEPEAQNKEPVPHEPQAKDVVEEVSQEKQHNDEHEGSPLEESESENSGLGYTPDSRKTTSTPLANKEDEQEQSEGDEEKTNGSSPGAANAAGASAIRRKRRLRSRRSVKCRAGEYDDTVGEGELLRSGSEPDSDASEHRSSDTSIGIGEPLDPSSQFVNEDMRIGGSPSRHHYRKKKDKKPKMRNLKRSSKKMGRSKEVLHSVFNEENERRGPNESYSEEGDGEAEDQRDKLLRELSQAEGESATQARVDLDDLKAELDGASLSEEYEKDVDEHTTATAPVDEEDEEEDVSDSWRHQKDSDDNSSDEGEEKSDFMKLVEEGDDDDDEQDRSRSRSSSGEDSEQEGGMKTSLDALKDQLAGLDFGDNSGSRPLRSESFTSLQNQLKGLDDLGSFGKLDSLDVTAGGEGEEEWRSRLLDGSEEKDDEEKNPSKPGASPLSSKSGTMKRRSILDVFDNYEGPGEAQKQAASTGERGDGALRAIAAREDINVTGLRRAKKTPSFGSMNRGTKKSIRPQYDMEGLVQDAHTVVYPFFEDKGSAFIAVLDGHAGFAVAQEGVKLFPQELKAHLESGKPADHNLADILKQTFASVDAQLTEHEFLGATATVVFVWTEEGKRYLQAANVGDSAAYIRRGNQTVKLTYDHKVTDEAERERLTNMGVELSVGATRINGLAVSRALGDHFMKENQLGLISEPYVSDPIELTDEDTMLIVASDGLWDVTSGEEAMQIVEGMDSVEDMASSLVRTAVSSSLCSDNVTVVVARL